MYYILNEKEEQIGPLKKEELTGKIISSTIIWKQGTRGWKAADTFPELSDILNLSPPPIPKQQKNRNKNQFVNNLNFIYSKKFDPKNILNEGQISEYKNNFFYSTFSTGFGVFLHFLTFGTFTVINCTLKFSKLPKIKSNDVSSTRAFIYYIIPVFNLIWTFIFWRQLAKRLNFQFKLRDMETPVSMFVASIVPLLLLLQFLCIIFGVLLAVSNANEDLIENAFGFALLPYLINIIFCLPYLYAQIQSASNYLAVENNS